MQAAEEGVTIPPEILEEIREWLREIYNIGRDDAGRRLPISVYRTVYSIVDGDGIRLTYPVIVGRHRLDYVRLKGVNAPERFNLCFAWWTTVGICLNQYHHGERAKDALERLTGPGTEIIIEGYYPLRIDFPGWFIREVCHCGVCEAPRVNAFVFRVSDGRDIVSYLLEEGYGPLWAAYGPEIGVARFRKLRSAMLTARDQKVGIWHPDPLPCPINIPMKFRGPLRKQPSHEYIRGRIGGVVWDLGAMKGGWRILCYESGQVGSLGDDNWRRKIPIEDWVLFARYEDIAGTEWEEWRR